MDEDCEMVHIGEELPTFRNVFSSSKKNFQRIRKKSNQIEKIELKCSRYIFVEHDKDNANWFVETWK